MNEEQFEGLLYEDESSTLDFKRDQYPFQGETPDVKSELLKDILAFANSWRRSDAYILVGVEEVRKRVSALRAAFPDLRFEASIYPSNDNGEFVTRRWTMTGSHDGEWMGIAPTGVKVTSTGMALWRFKDGKIAEEWIHRDDLGLMRQIGAL